MARETASAFFAATGQRLRSVSLKLARAQAGFFHAGDYSGACSTIFALVQASAGICRAATRTVSTLVSRARRKVLWSGGHRQMACLTSAFEHLIRESPTPHGTGSSDL
jgi:hypothetical protein